MAVDGGKRLLARGGCAGGILLACIAGAVVLIRTRPAPRTEPPAEPELVVRMLTAEPADVPVRIEAYGEARPVRVLELSAQIGGRIADMPRRLRPGDQVEKGERILQIETTDYEAALSEAEAAVGRIRASLRQLEVRDTSEREQLELVRRSRDLARSEFERLRRLSEQGQAVSIATVEAAERAYTQAQNDVLRLKQSLALLPAQREEAENELRAAQARRDQAQLHLRRCDIRAPFAARVTRCDLEEGAVLQIGDAVATLADDTALEIQVPVTAEDLNIWLPFEKRDPARPGWFPPLPDLPVDIFWTGADRSHRWTGALDRVVRFDADTRTAMVAVRVAGDRLSSRDGGLPLADGMFCRVELPGRAMERVIPLPRAAVTFDRKVYISDEGHLKTVDVNVVRAEDRTVYVRDGIQAGDRVVVTRLTAPLEGVRLKSVEE